jgi:hypothetical protein
VAETVGRFRSDADAKKFVAAIEKKLSRCPDKDLSAEVDQKVKIDSGGNTGTAWRVGLEVNKKSRVYYRMAIVRHGSDVTQVTFTPAGRYDISQKVFAAVATRASQRLVYLD